MTSPQFRFPLQDRAASSAKPPQSVSVKQLAAAAVTRAKLRLQEEQEAKAQRGQTTPPPQQQQSVTAPQAASQQQQQSVTAPQPQQTPSSQSTVPLWLRSRLDPAAANRQAAAPPLLAAQGTAPKPWANVFPTQSNQDTMAAKPSVPSTPAAATPSASSPPATPSSPAPLQNPIGPTPTTPATPAAATPAAATPAAATPAAATPAAATPAARLNEARNAGAVIEGDQITPHPDQKGGFLHHTGFALPTFRDVEQDPHIPYRDDHGKQHKIYARDIRRIADPSGKTSYQFMVGGQAVTVPEDSKAPIFQVDAAGKRFTQAADGTPRQIGIDPNAAAKAGIEPRENAAREALDKKLAQGADLTRQLQEKQTQVGQAQESLAAARQAVAAADQSTGPDSQQQRIRTREAVIAAEDALARRQQEAKGIHTQHAEHYRSLSTENRLRQGETGHLKNAAAAGLADGEWQQTARSVDGDPRAANLSLLAAAEKRSPAEAEAVRQSQIPAPTSRFFEAARSAFDATSGQPGDPAAAGTGKSMTLHDVLMKAPAMKLGKGPSETTVKQEDAAKHTASNALGITDPENVHVTRSADGSYRLARKAADGTDQPFATLDPKTNRITLTTGPDGRLSQAAQDMAKNSPVGSSPVYLPGGQPPLSATELSDLIAKGRQATSSTTDRKEADAALTAAGLSPEAIATLRQQGRLSVQDAKLLNDKFNGGVSSYAHRTGAEKAQQQDASLQQMQQDSKGTKDKPNLQSWLTKGDPQRDAQVQAKAKEMGVSEDAVRRDLETRRLMDFSAPATQESHEKQAGILNGLKRGLGLNGLAEPTRTLPDGTLLPHPALGDDRAKFDAAIEASSATPEAKAKARGLWDKYHDNYLTNVRATLERMPKMPDTKDYLTMVSPLAPLLPSTVTDKLPKVENYSAWRDRLQDEGKLNGLTENQKAEKYMEEQKGRNGFVKLIDNVGSNLLAGSHDLVTGIAGTAGLLTGSQTLSEFAAEKADEANRTTAALQYTGNDGTGARIIGGISRAVPGVVATAATGGTAGGILVAGILGTGTAFADQYQRRIDQGDTHEEARKNAAGLAIATGAASAVLTKIFPGGRNALNNPATREAVRNSFGAAVKSFFKGAADDLPQDLLDSAFNHISTEMYNGRSFHEAATSFAEKYPESLITSALLGGGMQVVADRRNATANGKTPPPPAQPAVAPQGKPHISGGVPELPDGAKLLQSSEHWFTFEQGGKKWVRFYAPEARSPNGAKKGGRGDGHDNTSAHLTPEGRIYVSEGQHRLNDVVLEGKTNLSSVPGHPEWLEYEYKGETNATGEAPAYSPGEPHMNENRMNPWDGMDGY